MLEGILSANPFYKKSILDSTTTVPFPQREPSIVIQNEEFVAPLPLSGFKTPNISHERLAAMGSLGSSWLDPNDERPPPLEKLTELGDYSSQCGNSPYPGWSPPELVPITLEEIEAIFVQLTEVFGFQYDNTRNMFDYFLRMLDSRASRMGPVRALETVHADYIGGINANFRKWYLAAQLDIDDTIGLVNLKHNGRPKDKNITINSISESQTIWYNNMKVLSPTDCVIQVGLYLLIWGEANNLRFMPECLCFIFKCCNDLYYSINPDIPVTNVTKSFLDHCITPLYNFYRDQCFHKINGNFVRSDKDHQQTIGYDDMNQLFWYSKGLERIILDDKTRLIDLPPEQRYGNLNRVVWKKAFFKTFKESRSWSHVLTNFNRIWIIHICMFWYYTSYNAPSLYTHRYNPLLDNQPTTQVCFTVMSVSGGIACLICLISSVFELTFIPRKYSGAEPLFKRFCMLLMLLIVNVGPTIYYLCYTPLNYQTIWGIIITSVQFSMSLITVVYLSVIPLGKLFNPMVADSRRFLPNEYFTLNFHQLKRNEQAASISFWFGIFLFKFVESYYYLTLSVREPIRELNLMRMTRCAGDIWIGSIICQYHPKIVLCLILLTDLVLYFLDTYLWYIVGNTVFSVISSFYIGASIWTPWRNIFSRLPKRIFTKIIATSDNGTTDPKYLVSLVWNSIIISMYREHLLSLEHVHKLIYKQMIHQGNANGDMFTLKEPSFFVSQEDMSVQSTLFHDQPEAQRRITFFAQSLSTPMRDIGPTSSMPSFTVLIPHYSEKITLSLQEIIREEDQYSNITLLEYLKKLHPLEWSYFVKDTRLLAEEFDTTPSPKYRDGINEKGDDSPYYSVGFKVASPEYILRTRIWASLRAQTLYRTISGFMNYSRAVKLLFDVENATENFETENNKLEAASSMALRKFRLVVTMQRLKYFTAEEKENVEFLLRTYPELQIAYLDEEMDPVTDEIVYYSTLIDGACPILDIGGRIPKYKIKLSGNPILGDGKSDNQNHAIIFTRGEYIQLVDANQDNYLEECLKVRSLLVEFEELSPPQDPYSIELRNENYTSPVAIIGTREYIFLENIGILGDVAAGKEKTFGTLFARTLAHIGGKLHYGHPDFLNAIFMTTRGGVSKAQKGLHLNEDIYAGMNVLCRGGKIKHCEYMQCGKGRDLGFGSILNFTTKIGTGMGEQMLSREQYYLSSKLPLDRFLSYYYAHPGFHLNNAFIILSIKLFLIVGVNIAALTNESTICEYNRYRPITDPHRPTGCHNLIPVVRWLERSILSIFIVFAMAFLPLFVQELMERGFYRSATRLSKHFISFSPLFEIFVCRVYAQSLVSDMIMGGARYIATGRGFATVRVPFAILYSRFATASLYFGSMSGLLVLYISIAMWKAPLLYFWVTVIGLIFCPFIYNPNQFSFNDFFIDYKNFLKWLSMGNSRSRASSWIGYNRSSRSRITGVKKMKAFEINEVGAISTIKSSRFSNLVSLSLIEFIEIAFIFVGYLFANSLNDSRSPAPTATILRILIVIFGPIIVNMIILLIFFVVSLVFGPFCSLICGGFPSFIAIIVHSLAIINHLFFFEVLWFLQNWDFSRTILGLVLALSVQNWLLKIFTFTVSREFRHDKVNRAWWSGKWFGAGLGFYILTQPFREFICKTGELSYFAADVVMGHMILFVQFPFLFIPFIDKWHTLMLFWLAPTNQHRPRLLTKRQKRKVRVIVNSYFLIFILVMMCFGFVVVFPMVITKMLQVNTKELISDRFSDLIQPNPINTSKKGLRKELMKIY